MDTAGKYLFTPTLEYERDIFVYKHFIHIILHALRWECKWRSKLQTAAAGALPSTQRRSIKWLEVPARHLPGSGLSIPVMVHVPLKIVCAEDNLLQRASWLLGALGASETLVCSDFPACPRVHCSRAEEVQK